MKKSYRIPVGIILSILVISNTNCSKNNSTSPPVPDVQLETSATLGKYLVDKFGHTLYFFAGDVSGQSTCTGNCELSWPIYSDSNLQASSLGAGLSLTDFASISTPEGKAQLTYKGWPLYNFAPGGIQEGVGQITGDGLDGGLFLLAKPDYTIMIGNAQLVGNDGNDYTPPAYTSGSVGITTYFTDARGGTLYTFANDSASENKFTKSDFSNNTTFPIYDTATIVVPSTLNK